MNKTRILDAYIECALWSSTDENDEPLDSKYYPSDLAPECLSQMRSDVHDFIASNESDLEGLTDDQIGHDFWLTRNGHGAGFWDRGLGDQGDILTKACSQYGEVFLYVGDDEMIHCG